MPLSCDCFGNDVNLLHPVPRAFPPYGMPGFWPNYGATYYGRGPTPAYISSNNLATGAITVSGRIEIDPCCPLTAALMSLATMTAPVPYTGPPPAPVPVTSVPITTAAEIVGPPVSNVSFQVTRFPTYFTYLAVFTGALVDGGPILLTYTTNCGAGAVVVTIPVGNVWLTDLCQTVIYVPPCLLQSVVWRIPCGLDLCPLNQVPAAGPFTTPLWGVFIGANRIGYLVPSLGTDIGDVVDGQGGFSFQPDAGAIAAGYTADMFQGYYNPLNQTAVLGIVSGVPCTAAVTLVNGNTGAILVPTTDCND